MSIRLRYAVTRSGRFFGRTAMRVRRSWRFRYGLQNLFLFLTFLCLVLAWLAWNAEHTRREREVIAKIEELGGFVVYDWGNPERPLPIWKIAASKLFGERVFANAVSVYLGSDTNDADLVSLARLGELEHVDTSRVLFNVHMATFGQNRHLTDRAVVHFRKLKTMKTLDLSGTAMTATAIAELRSALPECQILCRDDQDRADR